MANILSILGVIALLVLLALSSMACAGVVVAILLAAIYGDHEEDNTDEKRKR